MVTTDGGCETKSMAPTERYPSPCVGALFQEGRGSVQRVGEETI